MGRGFQYSILASGSSGNSFYLETEKKKILVGAGLSGKKITSLLAEIDRKPEDLDAIFVTHEHSDHIHGIGGEGSLPCPGWHWFGPGHRQRNRQAAQWLYLG